MPSLLGRDTTLTGRTDIWNRVLREGTDPFIGAGFYSFWSADRTKKLSADFHYELNEAHNGYLEMYLNLGWIGVCLIAFVLIIGYRHAVKAFQRHSEFGSLILAYIAAGAIYNLTEAGFREMNPCWIFLLLAMVSASGIAAGFLHAENPESPASRVGRASRTDIVNDLVPNSGTIYAVRRGLANLEVRRTSEGFGGPGFLP